MAFSLYGFSTDSRKVSKVSLTKVRDNSNFQQFSFILAIVYILQKA